MIFLKNKTFKIYEVTLVASLFALIVALSISPSVMLGATAAPAVPQGGPCTEKSADPNNPCFNYGNSPSYTLLEPLPCVNGNGIDCVAGTQIEKVNFKDYVQYMFNLLIALAAVAAVFMIVWGGFEYMSAEAPGMKSDGLKKVENAIYGLLLVLCSYLILRTVDPRLVEIPSTLVKPLNIQYKADEISAFFAALNKDSANFRAATTQIIANNYAIQQQIDAKAAERKVLCDKLESTETGTNPELYSAYMQSGKYADMCSALLDNRDDLSPEAYDIAMQITKGDDEKKALQTKQDHLMAQGLMNVQIQECYRSNVTSADCMNKISMIQNSYMKKLKDAGATVEAQKVADYGTYASAMANINQAVITNMSSDPYNKMWVEKLQVGVTAAGTAAGAMIGGGVVGAGVGYFTASMASDMVITGITASQNAAAAELTISQIQLSVNNNAKNIEDPQIREQFTAQSYALIKSLGGKGDGTDSPAKAEQKIGEGYMQQTILNR